MVDSTKSPQQSNTAELVALRSIVQQLLAIMACEYEKAGRGTPQSWINIIAANSTQMALHADVQEGTREDAVRLKQDIVDRVVAILSEIKFPSDRSNAN